jgi:hypothetical protein
VNIYIKTNNPVTAFALHILNNRHKYGNPKHNMKLLKTCNKGKLKNCWESFYMQVLQQENLLIDEPTQWTIRSSQHNETTCRTTRHPLQLGTRQTSTIVTSTKGVSQSFNKYIQHFHDIISIHPYNNVYVCCRFYLQPQTHTGCTRNWHRKDFILFDCKNDTILTF